LNASAVTLTPLVVNWLAHPEANQGVVFRGNVESLDGDADACQSEIRNIELVVDYIALCTSGATGT